MRRKTNPSVSAPSRRELFRASAVAAAMGLAAQPARSAEPNIYARTGVRPFINLTATYTINGGTLILPEVREAMDEASLHSVNIDELMEKVGQRLAELLGSASAMVTAGCAAALTHATAACVAGADPESMQQLPNLTGLKNEVIMPRQSRNEYDHAIRAVGVKIVDVDSPEEFHAALGSQTAMISVLGTAESRGKIRLEEMAQAGRKAGAPVLVDAAAEWPLKPNPYLSRGADLVAYSGGKIIRGPQCAGLLLGRKDLIQAARMNSSPHHAFGRSMKVGKEEIMGMLAAVEAWAHKRDIQSEYRTWESWLGYISEHITRAPGVEARLLAPAGASPFPVLNVEWDPERIGMTAGELGQRLLEGEPRIMSHAEGEGYSFLIRPAAMKPEHYKAVGQRLYELFRQAPKGGARPKPAAPVANLSGKWDADLQFMAGSSRHTLVLKNEGNDLTGVHQGRALEGDLRGTIDGDRVRFRSSLPYEGVVLSYTFTGSVSGERMSGDVDLGEYGHASWTAERRSGPAGA